ncbi:MAG: TetR family transcriptional regulator [Spirochaetes bacterium]|jgi:AcrR family transcriptional regulator|nr:TetR family transcriptional regulator [Spirochaetota bacterium]
MSEPGTGKQRDRKRTEKRLVDSAIEIIRTDGFSALGVNAIAERAGVSKVLIYRYFGDLSGLYRAVADELDPLQSRAAAQALGRIEPGTPLSDVVRRVVQDLHAAVKEDDLTKQLLIWELSYHNAITEAFSESREKTGLQLTDQYWEVLTPQDQARDLDMHALLAIITGAVFYLTLRSEAVSEFNGVDIGSEAGWERLADAVAELLKPQT